MLWEELSLNEYALFDDGSRTELRETRTDEREHSGENLRPKDAVAEADAMAPEAWKRLVFLLLANLYEPQTRPGVRIK